VPLRKSARLSAVLARKEETLDSAACREERIVSETVAAAWTEITSPGRVIARNCREAVVAAVLGGARRSRLR